MRIQVSSSGEGTGVASERFFAPCPRGLEAVLGEELTGLGAGAVTPTAGGVSFIGPFDLCYRVNLESRIASRVLWRVFHEVYRNEQDVYTASARLPWGKWFSVERTIKVRVSARDCPLKSLDFVTLRIKDAICDAFSAAVGVRPSVDTRHPDVRIDAFLNRTSLTLYLDTSGEALFKRGYRRAGGEAPLRENLAAGILRLSGWDGREPLLDPMCGSGTFLVEAAQMARRVAPGLGRHFAFERFNDFDERVWRQLCEASVAQQQGRAPLAMFGSDRSDTMLRTARANLEAAGVANAVTLQQGDVLDLTPPAEEGVLVSNPPYGVRTGEGEDLARFYPRLGNALKQRFAGWRVYLFTGDLRLPKLIRLSPSRRISLFNGALECRLYEFKLVRGPMRKARS
jgi:putative N6-adenine-specific DNA methylase